MCSDLSTEQKMLVERLSLIDNIDSWPVYIQGLGYDDKKRVYTLAERQWIKRKIGDGSLLLHPDIRDELIERQYSPLPLHRRMIWASVLASYDGVDSKEYFKIIKLKIIKKYDNKWWFDICNIIKPAFAAR